MFAAWVFATCRHPMVDLLFTPRKIQTWIKKYELAAVAFVNPSIWLQGNFALGGVLQNIEMPTTCFVWSLNSECRIPVLNKGNH